MFLKYIYLHSKRGMIKQINHIGIAHTYAANGAGNSQSNAVWRSMNVNVAAHGIDITQPVKPDFAT